MCLVLMHTIGLVCVGNGHQQHITSKLHTNDADARCVLYCALVVVVSMMHSQVPFQLRLKGGSG